jgi:hypothetical protein
MFFAYPSDNFLATIIKGSSSNSTLPDTMLFRKNPHSGSQLETARGYIGSIDERKL